MIVRPTIAYVAGLAGLVGIIFLVNEPFVYVLVAIRALAPDLFKFPFRCIIFMTRKTRRGSMSPFQFEFGQIVIRNSVSTALKTIDRVAFIAIGAYSVRGKIALVIIFMTYIAGIMCDRIGETFGRVAFPAIH